jgi:hypothetical protein
VCGWSRDHSVLQIEQFCMVEIIMILLCQWHHRLLLSRSFLSRAAIIYGGQRRSDLCRSISSTVFVFPTPLSQICDHHDQEWTRGTSPAVASRARWIHMSSRSGICDKSGSRWLLGHREGGVLLTQQRFASDDKNYRRSKFMNHGSLRWHSHTVHGSLM